MVQGLHLSTRLTQSLVLAPQLQQSLALLQAPTLELKALVEQELQQNPVLEEMAAEELDLRDQSERDSDEVSASPDPAEPPEDLRADAVSEKEAEEPVDDFQAEFDKLVQLDQEWRDHFSATNIPIRQTAEEEEKRQFMFDSLAAGTSFTQMLMDQVRETDLTDEQRGIAELIIGNIDDYGYLKATVEEMSASAGLPPEKIIEVLKVIQSFDPPGVGARDLRECLMLQLERAGRQDTLEYRIVRDFMDALGKRRIPEIARARVAPLTKCRRRWAASGVWNRARDAPFCRTRINTFCPKCSCKRSAAIWSSRPTTSTFRICASATSTKT